MVLVQSLVILISISVLFFVSDVYSQEPGTLMVQKLVENKNKQLMYPCRCYMRLDADEPVLLIDAGRFYSCEVISKQGSIVELILHSPTKNKISMSCAVRTTEEQKNGLWKKGAKSFEPSSKNENCILITDMSFVNERIDMVHITLYSFFLITLMGTLYAFYRYNLWMKLKERWQSQLEWDRLPLYVNFRCN